MADIEINREALQAVLDTVVEATRSNTKRHSADRIDNLEKLLLESAKFAAHNGRDRRKCSGELGGGSELRNVHGLCNSRKLHLFDAWIFVG